MHSLLVYSTTFMCSQHKKISAFRIQPTKKVPLPQYYSSPKQHPSPSSPISFKLWQQVRYLFFILTKQISENNVNFFLNIFNCWHEEGGTVCVSLYILYIRERFSVALKPTAIN